MAKRNDILFVYFHNAGPNQMAKEFFNRLTKEYALSLMAESAGAKPAERAHP